MNRTMQATDERVRANRLDLLSHLADDLAHEIKNPLHSVTINAELLRRRLVAGDVAAGLNRLDIIVAETARLNDIVDGLLRLFRPGRDAEEVLDLDRAIVDLVPVVQVPARLAGVELAYEPRGGEAIVSVTPAALDQVLLNMTLAALRECGTGGRLELTTAAEADAVSALVTLDAAVPAAGERTGSAEPDRPSSLDATDIAVAAELARRAGGRLERGEAGGAVGRVAFRLVLPRVSGA